MILAGFPGLRFGPDRTPVVAAKDARLTLGGIAGLGARQLVVLVERAELPAEAFTLLADVAGELEIDLMHCPIKDYSTPDDVFMSWWVSDHPRRAAAFARAEPLAFCCQMGRGRSGLVAALCLIEQGLPASDAIARIRAAEPAAIETAAQEAFVHEFVTPASRR